MMLEKAMDKVLWKGPTQGGGGAGKEEQGLEAPFITWIRKEKEELPLPLLVTQGKKNKTMPCHVCEEAVVAD